MDILYFWIAGALVFLVIEMITVTFYGLALSLSAGIVALYIFYFWEREFTIFQGLIFAVMSLMFAYALPKILSTSTPDTPQGFDRYIGEKRTVKIISDEPKISLDGVEYMIESDEDISAGDKVEVIGHKGASMRVKKESKK